MTKRMQQKIEEEESAQATSDKFIAGAETAPIHLGEPAQEGEENKDAGDDKRKQMLA